MSNRFARRIRDGAIRTPEELKSEFKALAKETHPDLSGQSATDDFVRVRAEYESALQDFERHRFGERKKGIQGASPRRGSAEAGSPDFPAFAAIAVLRKRGFPKVPRHEKERLRYEYARYRCQIALERLGAGRGGELESFERTLLAVRRIDPEAAERALRYLDALAEYSARGLPAMRTALVLDSAALRADPRLPGEARHFLAEISAVLGLGPALPQAEAMN